MSWRMRLDVEDDGDDERPSRWRRRGTAAAAIVAASLWLVALAVLAVWLAARVA